MGREGLSEDPGGEAEVRAWDGEEPAASTLVIRDVLVDGDWPGLPVVVPQQLVCS